MAAKAHAILSASSSDRWLHCPPSARLCEAYEDKGSDYAAEGTDAHSLAEHKLKAALGIPSEDPTESLAWYSEEMEDCTSGYAEYVLEQVESAKEACSDPVVLIEQRVDFSRWVEQGFGTADCIIIADGTLRVIDYKHGLRGARVRRGEPADEVLRPRRSGAVRRHLRHRHGRHDDLPAETPERQHLRDRQGRPVPLGGRGLEAHRRAGLRRRRELPVRRVVRLLQGKERVPRQSRGEPRARAARLQAPAAADGHGGRGHPRQGGRAGQLGFRHQGVRPQAGALREGVDWLQAGRGQIQPQVRERGRRHRRGREGRLRPVREEAAGHHRHAEAPRKAPLRRAPDGLHREAAGQANPCAGVRQAPGNEHSKNDFMEENDNE